MGINDGAVGDFDLATFRELKVVSEFIFEVNEEAEEALVCCGSVDCKGMHIVDNSFNSAIFLVWDMRGKSYRGDGCS
uniref:Uncharacterized protein n=1 Tax=Romanomermis culicivorax TaxID=13658 RepID=A0A915HMA4_ROMCU